MLSTVILKHFLPKFVFTLGIHQRSGLVYLILVKSTTFKFALIAKPFGTYFFVHTRYSVAAIITNWVAVVIHFSEKKATTSCDQSARYPKNYFLNFNFFMKCYVLRTFHGQYDS